MRSTNCAVAVRENNIIIGVYACHYPNPPQAFRALGGDTARGSIKANGNTLHVCICNCCYNTSDGLQKNMWQGSTL